MSETDHKDTQYIDVEWLRVYGLSVQNALDYFYGSHFFDPSSNNQILRNQGAGPEFLIQMTGLEYTLHDRALLDGRLFVIKKCLRSSPTQTLLLAAYYILEGAIYQVNHEMNDTS
jgi:hypothetical protein